MSDLRRGMRISHDLLLFCKTSAIEWNNLCDVLHTYDSVLSLQVNLDKTTIFFSPNTSENVQEEIKNSLNIRAINGIDKYLGVLLAFERSNKSHLSSIKDRMLEKFMIEREVCLCKLGD